MLGNNPEGVSDKTVAVLKFETLAGEAIAIWSNYGVHGTVLGQQNMQISGPAGPLIRVRSCTPWQVRSGNSGWRAQPRNS